ncbi:N-acetylmuramoyl-L-alanine amidase, partial [Ancylomarina sp.]|uniref:N-acetylmuramoyl-L-alanine amidase family protein n=1 Tax=Ancylomarina sp. TaxID=1970196 RepID=UPI00356322A2
SNKISQYIMNRVLFFSMFFILYSISFFCSGQNSEYKINTIVIDAGHGGKDPGAVGKHCYEKDIALSISLKAGKYIKDNFPNIEIVYTRETDVFIPLKKRPEIANKNKADLFLSIHANSLENNTRTYGTETFILGLHKSKDNLAVAMKENSVMLYEDDYTNKYEGFNPKDPASYIIFNLMHSLHIDNSTSMAQHTEHQFKNRVGRRSRGVKAAELWVLRKASMPSVLIEVGFISNPTEERFLRSEKGQDYMASGIFRAFRSYKEEIERHSSRTLEVKEKPIAIELSTEVYYCVQIKSSSKKISLNAKVFKGLANVAEKQVNGVYKYSVGQSSNLKTIINEKKEIKKIIPDCFIVAYHKGKPISIKEAKKIQKS